MVDAPTAGPERPTLVERFLGMFHLPYLLACLILGALVGPVGQFLGIYLDTLSLDKAFTGTFLFSYSGAPVPVEVGLFGFASYFLVIFWVFYGLGYLRLKLISAEQALSELSPDGETGFHRAFGGISSNKTPVILSTVLSIVFLSTYLFGFSSPPGVCIWCGGFFLPLYGWLSTILTSVGLSWFVWIYFRSLWGIHLFGKGPLRLKSFYEDRMLGLRPVGSLALTFALVFFVLGALGILSLLISPDPFSIVVITALIVFGVVMFFLPLNSIHAKMMSAKQSTQHSVRLNFVRLLDGTVPGEGDSPGMLSDLKKLISHQMVEQKANSISTWPFDATIIGRFAAIIISVLAIMMAKGIQILIGVK